MKSLNSHLSPKENWKGQANNVESTNQISNFSLWFLMVTLAWGIWVNEKEIFAVWNSYILKKWVMIFWEIQDKKIKEFKY